MSLPSLEINQERWNRMLIKSYWAALLISILVECLFLIGTKVPTVEFIHAYIIRPTVILAIVVLLAELGVRYLSKHHDYVLISAATLMTVTITTIHSSLEYLLFFLFFPIMISIFYFQYKKLLFAILNTGIALLCIYIFDPDINRNVTFVGLMAMASILLIYSGIAFVVLARGREVLIHLRTSYESNQELLVRTILMDKLAKTDALTDTYNHMAYHEYKDHLVEQADKGGMLLHLAIMDIDNFKMVNDTYGHKAGDEVLKEVASIARSKTGSNDIVARYGGEEFVILFTEKSFQEVFDLVEDIRNSIASTTHAALQHSNVTVSIGLNPYFPGMGREELFLGADAALYEAKHSGKNRTVLATAALTDQSISS
ncbi:sensor domain-containing diguanylate cyclase [Cohnella luojiensis]|uniref:GGDEF domain-containing protein n=1 Tax=Cohnella luojiensis TaxID=652876 RepID=A0A4Y8LZV0_9BACL|nr:GGDEF domain-containing protein [Cohnella luojiensis]TFE28074.1 GGDEF domain-containing protein [Cohnella luojiensis]